MRHALICIQNLVDIIGKIRQQGSSGIPPDMLDLMAAQAENVRAGRGNRWPPKYVLSRSALYAT